MRRLLLPAGVGERRPYMMGTFGAVYRIMNPIYFGSSEAPLFGVYHAPAEGAIAREAVLICPPVGHEYMRAHRVLHQLAETLAAGGMHVLRFDYAGTGDSWGEAEAATLEGWRQSILTAWDELRDTSGVERISVVGMRLGATLAAHALVAARGLRTLVLWDPVVDGGVFLEEIEALQRDRIGDFEAGRLGRRKPVSEDTDTIMGFAFSAALREGIRGLRLLPPGTGAVPGRVGVVGSAERSGDAALCAAYTALGSAVTYRVLADAGDWRDFRVAGGVMLAGGLVREVVAMLGGEAR